MNARRVDPLWLALVDLLVAAGILFAFLGVLEVGRLFFG